MIPETDAVDRDRIVLNVLGRERLVARKVPLLNVRKAVCLKRGVNVVLDLRTFFAEFIGRNNEFLDKRR